MSVYVCGDWVCNVQSHWAYVTTALRTVLKASQMMCDKLSSNSVSLLMTAKDFPNTVREILQSKNILLKFNFTHSSHSFQWNISHLQATATSDKIPDFLNGLNIFRLIISTVFTCTSTSKLDKWIKMQIHKLGTAQKNGNYNYWQQLLKGLLTFVSSIT